MGKKIDFDKIKITDDMLFNTVLYDKYLLCEFVKMCTDIKEINAEDIDIAIRENTVNVNVKSKGVRFDIYMMTDEYIFDIEMQNKESKYLPERIRYYQSLLDIEHFKRGMKYKDLKTLYIIFVCNFIPCKALGHSPIISVDSFYHDKYNDCEYINYNDRVNKILLNLKCDISKIKDINLKSFIEFMCDGYNYKTKTPFVEKMKQRMDLIKNNDEWRRKYMLLQEKLNELEEEHIISSVKTLLKMKMSKEDIIHFLCESFNITSLEANDYLEDIL